MKKQNVVIIIFLLLLYLDNTEIKYDWKKILKWGAANLQVM